MTTSHHLNPMVCGLQRPPSPTTALGLTPVEVYGAAGTAMAAWARAHPEAVQAAQDFVGNFIPGDVPVQSKAGVAGAIAAKGWERHHE